MEAPIEVRPIDDALRYVRDWLASEPASPYLATLIEAAVIEYVLVCDLVFRLDEGCHAELARLEQSVAEQLRSWPGPTGESELAYCARIPESLNWLTTLAKQVFAAAPPGWPDRRTASDMLFTIEDRADEIKWWRVALIQGPEAAVALRWRTRGG